MRAFFIECSLPFWIHVAENFESKNGWKILYWTGTIRLKTLVNQKFPHVIFHENSCAVRNIIPKECENINLPCLGQDLLKEFAVCESTVLKMMDRMAHVNAFPYHERIRHYHQLLRYWLAVLDNLKPDIVINPTSPHLVYDYILYEVCKYYKIQTVMFEKTSFPGYLLPVQRFEEGSDQFLSTYRNECGKKLTTEIKLQDDIEARLAEICGTYSEGMPFHVKFKNKNKNRSLTRRIYSILRKGAPSHLYQKYSGQKLDDFHLTRTRYIIEILKAELKRKELREYYISKTSDVDIKKPFIFVALQCQPERSTSPDGGVFAHQNLMVEMLSKYVLKNWQIYVKEHISQFKSFQKAECSRTKEFYDDLHKLPNVKFVPLSVFSFELIDASKAVATVSGTVGFESIIRNKPALVFGHAWYNGCEGIFSISDAETCKKHLSQISSGYSINHRKVRLFLQAFESIATRGYMDNIYKKAIQIDPLKNAMFIYKAIVNTLDKN